MAAGSVTLGPQNGTITVRTYREGMAKRVGHDLALEVTNWSATAAINRDDPASSDVKATLDLRSLEVREATGGVKPLSNGDRKDISKNLEKTLNLSSYPEVTFASHSIDADGGHRLRLNGNLTLSGATRPVSVDLNLEQQDGGERLTGTVTVTHSDFGVKPYSGFMGTLKIKDAVEIDFDVKLPQG
jgi:polyisoprenoid-binding protein YceI